MRAAQLLIAALLSCVAASAQASPRTVEREIAQLFTALSASRCQFHRNGTWYDARKASEHLQRKYDYLRRQGRVTTTEAFIEQAASTSSFSGKPYLVRCGDAPPVPSRSWFTRQLGALRAAP